MIVNVLLFGVLGTWNNEGWASNPPTPAKRSSWASDPFERRILPASMIRVPEPERKPEPKADMPPVCSCVLTAGECRCAAEAKESEAAKPAPTFTPGLAYPPKAAVDEWRPFTANPAYEVLGHEDETGTFRYTTSRLKAGYAAPDPTYSPPAAYSAAPAYSAGSSCAGSSCAQPQAQGFNLFRGYRGR